MHPFLSTLLSPSLVPYWLGTYAVLFLSWFLACAFFELCEQRQWLRAYAIQPSQSPPSWALKRRALEMAALNWAWLPFALFAAAPVLRLRFSAEAPFPPLPLFAVQLVACFLLDDCCFYAYHRVLHVNKKLYVRFHKPHHVFTAPFAWTSHAVHPVEMALQSVGAMLGPALFGFSLHALWAWYVVRQWQGVLDHTGLHLPIDPIGWLPGVGGTKFHDEHHQYGEEKTVWRGRRDLKMRMTVVRRHSALLVNRMCYTITRVCTVRAGSCECSSKTCLSFSFAVLSSPLFFNPSLSLLSLLFSSLSLLSRLSLLSLFSPFSSPLSLLSLLFHSLRFSLFSPFVSLLSLRPAGTSPPTTRAALASSTTSSGHATCPDRRVWGGRGRGEEQG